MLMIIQAIKNSFLLTNIQKEYLINNINEIPENEIYKLLWLLDNEKNFTLSLLKKYKDDNKNTSIAEIKWELINENIKRIQTLELSENDIFDLEKEFENIM